MPKQLDWQESTAPDPVALVRMYEVAECVDYTTYYDPATGHFWSRVLDDLRGRESWEFSIQQFAAGAMQYV